MHSTKPRAAPPFGIKDDFLCLATDGGQVMIWSLDENFYRPRVCPHSSTFHNLCASRNARRYLELFVGSGMFSLVCFLFFVCLSLLIFTCYFIFFCFITGDVLRTLIIPARSITAMAVWDEGTLCVGSNEGAYLLDRDEKLHLAARCCVALCFGVVCCVVLCCVFCSVFYYVVCIEYLVMIVMLRCCVVLYCVHFLDLVFAKQRYIINTRSMSRIF
jgi:hypothetical protein